MERFGIGCITMFHVKHGYVRASEWKGAANAFHVKREALMRGEVGLPCLTLLCFT